MRKNDKRMDSSVQPPKILSENETTEHKQTKLWFTTSISFEVLFDRLESSILIQDKHYLLEENIYLVTKNKRKYYYAHAFIKF